MRTGYPIVHRMTQAELDAGDGIGLWGGFIEVVDASGTPTGPMYITGVVGAEPIELGAGSLFYREAGANLAAYTTVYDVDGVHALAADNSSMATAGTVLGMTDRAYTTGQLMGIIHDGEIILPSLGVTGAIYLASAGALTLVPPVTGVLVKMGYIPVATKIVVRMETPIQLV